LAGRARVPCAKGDNGTPLDLDSAVNFGPGEEVPHLGSEAAHGVPRASREPAGVRSSGQNLGWKLRVRDKCVKQESRTLDPVWRDSASLAQKRNICSRRPSICESKARQATPRQRVGKRAEAATASIP